MDLTQTTMNRPKINGCKYKGRTYFWIKYNEPSYLEELLKHPKTGSVIKEIIKETLEKKDNILDAFIDADKYTHVESFYNDYKHYLEPANVQ